MKLAAILAAFLLTGCSVGHVQNDSTAEKYAQRQLAGIPYVLSMTGTATAISPHVSITARHVADTLIPADHVLGWHPKCDLAFIAADNTKQEVFPAFAAPQKGEAQLYGYSARTYQPVSGSGQIVGVGKLGDCLVWRADAGGMQGMSGGPVVQDGRVVGIIVALDMTKKEVIFVGMDVVKNWMDRLHSGANPKP